MSVRLGAGGAFFRVSSCETYDSVTRAARARSRCSKPSSSNRSRITNATSTGQSPVTATILTATIKSITQSSTTLDKHSKSGYVAPAWKCSAGVKLMLESSRSHLMYARNVTLHLKANSAPEFTRTLETDILPVLRKQNGFKDEITFVTENGRDALAISLWEKQENAEAYSRDTYPTVLQSLAKVVDGTPRVEAYEVSNSTFHKIASKN